MKPILKQREDNRIVAHRVIEMDGRYVAWTGLNEMPCKKYNSGASMWVDDDPKEAQRRLAFAEKYGCWGCDEHKYKKHKERNRQIEKQPR